MPLKCTYNTIILPFDTHFEGASVQMSPLGMSELFQRSSLSPEVAQAKVCILLQYIIIIPHTVHITEGFKKSH